MTRKLKFLYNDNGRLSSSYVCDDLVKIYTPSEFVETVPEVLEALNIGLFYFEVEEEELAYFIESLGVSELWQLWEIETEGELGQPQFATELACGIRYAVDLDHKVSISEIIGPDTLRRTRTAKRIKLLNKLDCAAILKKVELQ